MEFPREDFCHLLTTAGPALRVLMFTGAKEAPSGPGTPQDVQPTAAPAVKPAPSTASLSSTLNSDTCSSSSHSAVVAFAVLLQIGDTIQVWGGRVGTGQGAEVGTGHCAEQVLRVTWP